MLFHPMMDYKIQSLFLALFENFAVSELVKNEFFRANQTNCIFGGIQTVKKTARIYAGKSFRGFD